MLKQVGFVPAFALKNPIARTALSRSRVNWMATSSPAGRLRELAAGTRRGAAATPEALKSILELVQSLESSGWQGPGPGPLASDVGRAKLDGTWELLFQVPKDSASTADRPGALQTVSIAAADGQEGHRGRVLQKIETSTGRIENYAETWWGTARVEARFAPLGDSSSEVEVVFEKAWLSLGPFPELGFPISWFGGRGTLDTTYLSDDLRIGRGDKGTVFCLARPNDD